MIFLKALRHIITLIILLFALATAFAAWSVRIAPDEAGMLCLSWFAFPYMWLALVSVTIISFAFKSWFIFTIGLAVACATGPSALQVIDIPTSQKSLPGESRAIKILTYNVHAFGYADEMDRKHAQDSLVSFLLESDADVICFQETIDLSLLERQGIAKADELCKKYPYVDARRKGGLGQTTISRLPMIPETEPKESLDNLIAHNTAIADNIIIGNDTICVINCHLASLTLNQDLIHSVSGHEEMDSQRIGKLRKTYELMRKAFHEREGEINVLSGLVNSLKRPVIICGDFNDTPISNTYYTVTSWRGGLTDTRAPRRIGMARTYRGDLPPLRIDYILTTNEFASADYAEHDLPTSDHKALTVSVALKSVK